MNSNWINNAHTRSSITKILKGWFSPNKAFHIVTLNGEHNPKTNPCIEFPLVHIIWREGWNNPLILFGANHVIDRGKSIHFQLECYIVLYSKSSNKEVFHQQPTRSQLLYVIIHHGCIMRRVALPRNELGMEEGISLYSCLLFGAMGDEVQVY